MPTVAELEAEIERLDALYTYYAEAAKNAQAAAEVIGLRLQAVIEARNRIAPVEGAKGRQ